MGKSVLCVGVFLHNICIAICNAVIPVAVMIQHQGYSKKKIVTVYPMYHDSE